VLTIESLLIKDEFDACSNAGAVATEIVTDTMSMKEELVLTNIMRNNHRLTSKSRVLGESGSLLAHEVFEDKRLLHNHVSDVWKNKIVNQK